jgi:hypothetical protein
LLLLFLGQLLDKIACAGWQVFGVLKRRQARGASLQVAGRGADLATAAEKLSIIRTATFMVLPGQMRTKRHGPFTGDPDYFHSTFFTLGTVDEQ